MNKKIRINPVVVGVATGAAAGAIAATLANADNRKKVGTFMKQLRQRSKKVSVKAGAQAKTLKKKSDTLVRVVAKKLKKR